MKPFAFAFALVWSYQVVRADEAPPPAAPSPTAEQRTDVSTLPDEKLGELHALRAEVARLRQQIHHSQSILFELKIFEISREKLTDAQPGDASDASLIERLTAEGETRGPATGILSASGKKLLDRLRADAGALKVVAEPSILTVAGRPASMLVGGEIALPALDGNPNSPVRYRRYGTTIDIVPVVLDGEKLRFDLRLELSQLDYANSIEINGEEYPAIVSRSLDFATEAGVGQTIAVVLPEAKRAKPEDVKATRVQLPAAPKGPVETLVLITPLWVDAMVAKQGTDAGFPEAPPPPALSSDAKAIDDAAQAHRKAGSPPCCRTACKRRQDR